MQIRKNINSCAIMLKVKDAIDELPEDAHSDSIRVTIIIGILGIFVAVLIYLTSFFPIGPSENKPNLEIISLGILFFNFLIVFYYFLSYLVRRASSLKYKKGILTTLFEDMHIIFLYVIALLFRRKLLKDKKKFLESTKHAPGKHYTYYYDEGINFTKFLPITVLLIIFINLTNTFFQNTFSLQLRDSVFIAMLVFFVALFILTLLLNMIRYALTGTQ